MLRKNSKLLNLKRSKKNCEFCSTQFVSEDDTVCGPCDRKMELEYLAKMKALMAKHSAKYKCQTCGDGLPVSRRVKCETCEHNHPVDFDERYIEVA